MSVDLTEIDRFMELVGPRFPVISDKGFTIGELADAKQMSRSTAERIVKKQLKTGIIEQIGVRPGQWKDKVYAIKK